MSSAAADLNQNILRQRATRYGRLVEAEASQTRFEGLLFARGGAQYILRLSALREVRQLRSFCPILGARPVVPGIFSYRGEVLSLHDLAALVGSPAEESRWIIVVQHRDLRMGLMADEVQEVRVLSEEAVHPAPITMGVLTRCLQGVLASGERLLQHEALFTEDRFFKGL